MSQEQSDRIEASKARVVYSNYVVDQELLLLKKKLTAKIVSGSGATLEGSTHLDITKGQLILTPEQVSTLRVSVIPILQSPTNITLIPGNEEITVTFTGPVSDDFPITNYEYSIDGGVTFVLCNPPKTTSPIVIAGLTNGTIYQIVLRAVNQFGPGLPSSPKSGSPQALAPSAPRNLSANAGFEEITLSWSPPLSDGGSAISNYTITYGEIISDVGLVLTSTFTGLQNGTAYTFSITATNTSSITGPAATITSTPYGPPLQITTPVPTNSLDSSGILGNQIQLSWIAPSNNGSAITQYTIQWTSADTSGTKTVIGSPPVTNDRITGLTNGTYYRFTVYATNAGGNGPSSDPSGEIKPVGPPLQPRDVSGTVGTTGRVDLFWSPPSSNEGSELTGYTITGYDVSGSEFVNSPYLPKTITDPSLTNYAILGLTNGKPYRFTITAENAYFLVARIGNPAILTLIPATLPNAPLSGTVTVGNQSCTLNWADSSGNGSAILNYTVIYNGITIPDISPTNITILNLVNGTAYTFTVFSTNAIGRSLTGYTFSPATPAKGPDPPTISAISLDRRIQVNITAPTDTGGNPIAGYSYQVDELAYVDTSGNNSFTILDLTNGTVYNVNVKAYTRINSQNVYSAQSNTVTVTPSTVPSVPRDASGTIDNQQTLLSWQTPSSNGGADLSGYIVTYNDSSGIQQSSTFNNTVLLNPYTGLRNGFQYTFSIVATNLQGSSFPATVVVTPSTTPSDFTGVYKLDGNTFGYIYFDPVDDGGSPILAYEYFYDLSGVRYPDNSGYMTENLLYIDNSLTISELENGNNYNVTIRARNARGPNTPYSIIVSPKTPSPPFPPKDVSGTAFSTLVTVTFTPGNNGNRRIEKYKYSLGVNGFYVDVSGTPILDNSGNRIAVDGAITNPIVYFETANYLPPVPEDIDAPPETTVTITSLINGTKYTIRIMAVNDQGDGIPSPPVILTPATQPSAPTGLSATAGVRQVSINLTCENGGQPILNYLYSTDQEGTFTELSPAQATSPITISGLTNGAPYIFYIKARNIVGTGDASIGVSVTLPDVPAVPSVAPTVGRDVSGSIQVTLTPPSNGGLSITGYSVYAYDLSNVSHGTTLDSSGIRMTPFSTTTGVIGGLINGASYTFKFTATNAAGTSGFSPDSLSIQPGSKPLAPQILNYTTGYDTITVTYSAPSDTGGFPILGYEYSTNNTNWSGISASSFTFTATDLTNGEVYTIYLRAVNTIGDGVATSQSGILVASAPLPMLKPSVALGVSQQIILGWSPPDDDGGSAVTRYIVNAYIDTSGVSSTLFFATDTSGTIGGLTNGTTYTFKVAATNVKGTGELSSASDPIIPATVPAQMLVPQVTRGGSGEINIRWVAPSNRGSAIIEYIVKAYIGNTQVSSTRFLATDTSGTIGGLTNGTTYTFRVAARNIQGTGEDSPGSATISPASVPAVPAAPTVVRGIQQLTVTWTAPDSGGSPIREYILLSYTIGGEFRREDRFNNMTFSASISPLTNGTFYKFTIAARNDLGTSTSLFSIPEKPATVPSAPAAPGVLRGGSGQVALTWSAPSSDGGADVSGYTITTCDNVGTAITVNDVSGIPIGPFVYAANIISSTISWLVNGTTYRFTVAATNSEGTTTSGASQAIIPATVPDAPQISATVYSEYVTIQIVPGSNQGLPITGYQYSINEGSTWVSASDSSGSPFNITGLTNGTTVSVYVRAVNDIGPGTYASTPVVMFYPAAPTDVSGTIPNISGTISLRWTPPTPTSEYPLTGYTITSVSGSPIYDIGPGEISYKISGLANGTTYVFNIAATILQGSGSSRQSAPLTPIGYPAAPTGVSGISLNSSVEVSWTPVVPFDQYTLLGYYVYTYNASAALVKTSPLQLSSPYTVPDLTTDTYRFTVAANISQGNGPESTLSDPVIVFTLPGIPVNLSASAGFTSTTVTWSEPSTGGTPITGYTLTYIDTSGVTQTLPFGGSTSTSDPIIGLAAGFRYVFKLTATNQVGTSSEATYTRDTTPAAPSNVSATISDSQTVLTWTAPVLPYLGTIAGITGYDITYTDGNGNNPQTWSFTGTGTTTTITGLSNGAPGYIFSVATKNSEGTGPKGSTGVIVLIGGPDAPQSLTATAGNTSALIQWVAPSSDGGSPITYYNITSSPSLNVNVNSSTLNYVAQGLITGIAYTFTVTTWNANASSNGASITVTPDYFAQAPIVSILAGGGAAGNASGIGTAGQGTDALFNRPNRVAVDSNGIVYVADTNNNTIKRIGTTGIVSIFAGGGAAGNGTGIGLGTAQGTNALFKNPYGVAVDSNGIVYVADSSNNTIKRIGTTGIVNILAGGGAAGNTSGIGLGTAQGTNARFNSPFAIAVDSNGIVYVGDRINHTIKRIGTTGIVSVFAGGGAGGTASGIGLGTAQGSNARFNSPWGVAVDSNGIVYVSDTGNNTIKRIGTTGIVSIFAGGGVGGTASGIGLGTAQGTNALFNFLSSVTVDSNGIVYVSEIDNSTIKRIGTTGIVSVLAGGGAAGNTSGIGTAGQGTNALFNQPFSITVDSNGIFYVADTNNNTIKILQYLPPAGVPTAPTSLVALPGDQSASISFTPSSVNGGAAIASYQYSVGTNLFTSTFIGTTSPITITNIIDASGALVNGTTYSIRLVAVNSSGIVGVPSAAVSVTPGLPLAPQTVTATAGNTTASITWAAPASNGGFPITSYTITSSPAFINATVNGVTLNYTAQGLTNGTSYTFTVTATNSAGTGPSSLSGSVTPISFRILAGGGATGNASGIGLATAEGTNALFNGPFGIAVDSNRIVYVADKINNTIKRIGTTGIVSIFAGGGATGIQSGVGTAGQGTGALFTLQLGVAVDSNGILYVTDTNNNTIKTIGTTGIVRILAGGGATGNVNGIGLGTAQGTNARFSSPVGIAVDSNGIVYVADTNNNTIKRIGTTGIVSVLAGGGATGAGTGIGLGTAQGTNARFNFPWGLAVDSNGIVYVADRSNHTIKRIGTTGIVSIFAGGGAAGNASGIGLGTAQGSNARFNQPLGVRVDSNGIVYVTDTNNNTIKTIGTTGVVSILAGGGASGTASGIGTAGQGTGALFNGPFGVTVDSNGIVYIADTNNNTIKIIDQTLAPVGIPTAPTNLVGSPGNQSASISFTPSFVNGGSSIANYQYSIGTSLFTTGFIGTASPLTINTLTDGITALENETPYTISLVAVNSSGIVGVPSAPVTVTPLGVPPAPTSVSGTAAANSVVVSWTAPTPRTGYPLSGFGIVCYDSGNNVITTVISTNPADTSGTVTGLTTAGNYTFKVYATISFLGVDYPGAYSEASSAVSPITTPSAPLNLAGTIDTTKTVLTWTAPAFNGDLIGVTGYTISYTDGNGNNLVNLGTVTNGSTYTISSLNNGPPGYIISVAAVNALGTGVAAIVNVTPAIPFTYTGSFNSFVDSGTTYYKFTTSGTITFVSAKSGTYLIVGGGGGGGGSVGNNSSSTIKSASGGGGGGVSTGIFSSLTTTDITIGIGGGGGSGYVSGAAGGNSIFNSITASPGSGGGWGVSGGTGGSGGGGAGGMGAVTSNSIAGGNGGNGPSYYGSNFAGGGGGGGAGRSTNSGSVSRNGGSGGSGGGGAGGNGFTTSGNTGGGGTPNTGGGGGGGGSGSSSGGAGGAGGTGVVILSIN